MEQAAKASKVAVIFDLDSTLFCVSPRTQAILRTLGEELDFTQRQAELSELLRNVEVLPTDWGIRTVLERSKAQAPIEVFKEVRNYWRTHFFANHYLDKDTIYPAANEYVRHLHDLGAEILYLTGRSQGSMQEGTKRMLTHWGFPFFSDAKLFMKPSDVESDEGFKAEVLKDLVKHYSSIWFFENEPVIIEQIRAHVPQVHIVYMDSVHSGRALPPRDLPTIGMDYTTGLPPEK